MRMMLKAGFDTYSGYGNDAVDMAVQLEKMGIDVVPWPSSIISGLPRAFTQLLQKDPGGDYDVALQFAPPYDVHPQEFAPYARTAVGWSMWERTPLQRNDMKGHGWKNPGRRKHWWSAGKGSDSIPHREKDWLDLMVVTNPDSMDAFQALDPYLPYSVVPNGIDVTRFPELGRTDDRPFRFGSIGMLNGRKDPFATIEAFRLAQRMDPEFHAELVLKTSTPGLHPAINYPGITVINEVWEPAKVVAFYSQIDVLVSTSRGEGNNKPAMEFMSTGGPVMATAWSGHLNWLHPDSGYPLSGRLVEDPRNGTSDFRVNVDHVARTMLHCYHNREEVRRKGEQAALRIRADLTWEHVCDRLMQAIGRVM